MRLVCRAKDKSKMKTHEQKAISAGQLVSLFCIKLVWVRIHCESKMEKQGFQTGESLAEFKFYK